MRQFAIACETYDTIREEDSCIFIFVDWKIG